MYLPVNYWRINMQSSFFQPSDVKNRNNIAYNFWERSLYSRMRSALDVEGWPEEWNGPVEDFFWFCIFRYGFVGIFEDPKMGLCFNPGTLNGYNFYYQFTEFILTNPKLKKRFQIGKDCEILKLNPDYIGSWDIIAYYAEKLSNLDASIDMSIVNSRTPYILGASTKAAAETFKKVMEKSSRGEPVIVTDAKLLHPDQDGLDPWKFLDLQVKQNYLLPEQLTDFQTILNNFDAEVGIPSLPYQKKERLVSAEADMRSIDATARAATWVEVLNSCSELINKRFGTSLKFKLRYDATEEGAITEDEEVDDNVDL